MSAELMRLLSNITAPGSSLKLMRSPGACAFAARTGNRLVALEHHARGSLQCVLPPSPGEQVVIACIGGNPETP